MADQIAPAGQQQATPAGERRIARHRRGLNGRAAVAGYCAAAIRNLVSAAAAVAAAGFVIKLSPSPPLPAQALGALPVGQLAYFAGGSLFMLLVAGPALAWVSAVQDHAARTGDPAELRHAERRSWVADLLVLVALGYLAWACWLCSRLIRW